LTDAGWAKVRASAPGHVATVRGAVIDARTPEQVRRLTDITDAILARIDPDRTLADVYERYDDRTGDDAATPRDPWPDRATARTATGR
jgi:hypothetical protein